MVLHLRLVGLTVFETLHLSFPRSHPAEYLELVLRVDQ